MSTTTTTPELIQRLGERLNEEKWTRTALGNYTVANFEELDAIVREIHEADLENEAHDACTNHLEQSKDSIGALYISGLLDVSRQLVNDGNLIMLTRTFTDNHKPKLVEYLANRILDFGENRFALRILADVYEADKGTPHPCRLRRGRYRPSSGRDDRDRRQYRARDRILQKDAPSLHQQARVRPGQGDLDQTGAARAR